MKRRGVDPVIVELRTADCVLSLASRIGGPRGFRLSCDEADGPVPELDDARVRHAIEITGLISEIPDPATRRVMSVFVGTAHCSTERTVRDVAHECKIPKSSVHRHIARGLAFLKPRIAALEKIAA